jgi:hypothetical protein
MRLAEKLDWKGLKISSLGFIFVFDFNAHIVYTEESVFSRALKK